MFTRFSDSERELIIARLRDFDFIPLLLDNGQDLMDGSLVTANDDRGLKFIVDLTSGFDRTTGIPDKYFGCLVDDQLFEAGSIELSSNSILESIVTLPNSLCIEEEHLDAFLLKLQSNLSLVNRTDRHALTKQRLGQKAFRDSLIEHWNGRCVATGMSNLSLLRASHIKPWAKCKNDDERLDVANGLLLSANYDAAFDSGLITFSEIGELVFSDWFSQSDRAFFFIESSTSINFCSKTAKYMDFHREHVFKS